MVNTTIAFAFFQTTYNSHSNTSAPLKLRPHGAIQIRLLLSYYNRE